MEVGEEVETFEAESIAAGRAARGATGRGAATPASASEGEEAEVPRERLGGATVGTTIIGGMEGATEGTLIDSSPEAEEDNGAAGARGETVKEV